MSRALECMLILPAGGGRLLLTSLELLIRRINLPLLNINMYLYAPLSYDRTIYELDIESEEKANKMKKVENEIISFC